MCLVSLIRGFKVRVSDFDAFLKANGLSGTYGYEPFPSEAEQINKIFEAQGVDCEVGVFVPFAEGFNNSRYLIVCCDWIHVFASREIEGAFQEPVPHTFEQLHDSLGAESDVSKYIVVHQNRSYWTPEELIKRHTVH